MTTYDEFLLDVAPFIAHRLLASPATTAVRMYEKVIIGERRDYYFFAEVDTEAFDQFAKTLLNPNIGTRRGGITPLASSIAILCLNASQFCADLRIHFEPRGGGGVQDHIKVILVPHDWQQALNRVTGLQQMHLGRPQPLFTPEEWEDMAAHAKSFNPRYDVFTD